MKFVHPLMTVAAALAFSASPQVHAQAPAEREAAAAASDSPAVVVAQAEMASPRARRVHERMSATESADPGMRGARAAAQHGPEALRRYIDRTRMIYALDYRDFVTF